MFVLSPEERILQYDAYKVINFAFHKTINSYLYCFMQEGEYGRKYDVFVTASVKQCVVVNL